MNEISAELHFGPNVRHIADYANSAGEILVRLIDDGWMEGDWTKYVQASTVNGAAGQEYLALSHIDQLKDLNLSMVYEDLNEDLGEDGWELLRTEETTKLAADANGITCFPVFKLTFRLESVEVEAMRAALSEHLQMAELSLGSGPFELSPEELAAFSQKASQLGPDWSAREGVILMNPRVNIL